MNRRNFLSTVAIAPAAMGASVGLGQSDDGLLGNAKQFSDFGFLGPEDDPQFGAEILGGSKPGQDVATDPSRHEEVALAFRLLFNAPRDKDHMKIVEYIANIKEKNGNSEPYIQEWKVRANPLIVAFFSMTNTKPSSGDQVAWCAAFVSFVLYASGRKGKFSALSGAYRSYGTPTDDPQYGDIVVFRKKGEDGNKGFGHVSFYVDNDETTVTLLGGNQRGDTGSTGAITLSKYKLAGSDLELDSYRRLGP